MVKAAVLYEPHRPLTVEQIDLDGPADGEIRVKLVGAGVCHSDYHRVDGHTVAPDVPYVMGHEGRWDCSGGGHRCEHPVAGRPRHLRVGGPVRAMPQLHVGRTNLCETFGPVSGRSGYPTRFSKDGVPYHHGFGAFAEETVVAAETVVKIREDVPLEKACLIGCGVMTGVGAVVNRARVETGSTVAVFGCGGVGLNVVQGAALASASKIIAVDRVDFKLQKAEEMGATHFVNSTGEDPVQRITEITEGGADYAFEVVGNPGLMRQAFESVRPGGTAVMVGVAPHGAEVTVMLGAIPGPDGDGHLLWERQTEHGLSLVDPDLSGRQAQAGRADHAIPSAGRGQRGV